MCTMGIFYDKGRGVGWGRWAGGGLKSFTSFMGLFCPVFWEKYSTYHPYVIIIKYNSKKWLLTIKRLNYEWKYWTNV